MEREDSFGPGRLITRLARLQARWLEGRVGALGLAPAQIPVLAVLKEGARTQTELARLIGTEQPTMAQLLGRMERDGLVRRVADPKDGRSALVLLTRKAERALPGARAVLAEGSVMALAGLSEREVATLTRLLGRVLENVEGAVLGDGTGL